ncbi:phosphotransferase family protein [Hydrocarboniclastica marina]|uniref:Phosphotransferase family protein n=1 Tax=Hydrocarboniclastica marina TaxID=2259620 RepID=A0A4P7XLZ7_9ALTE|nr:phosphotransferase family protein [Hydrocarboniclastica marina]QCF28015.1 phosphotransferase family protein [Hydrocarboniclastica marina]
MAATAAATQDGGQEQDFSRLRVALSNYLSEQTGRAGVQIRSLERLSGGAIQENWMLHVDVPAGQWQGARRWVLRTDSPTAVNVSMSRAAEYAVLKAVHGAGVQVPKPLWLCRDPAVIGRDFFLMEAVGGTAAGHRLVRDASLVPDTARLCRELGGNLARLHLIRPPVDDLNFLPAPAADPAQATIDEYRGFLDALDDAFPVIEWGLRWLQIHKPKPEAACLVHRDFRTGNFMVDQGAVSGILDWEFTGWGDWREDIGWFTAKCWRFGNTARVAGGIGHLDDFMAGYAAVIPRQISAEALRYWQLMAHVRWAIVAVQQAERHLSGRQHSLELALTGRMVPELEYEILKLTGDSA